MKKLLVILTLLALPVKANAAITYMTHVAVAGGGPSAAISTSGANLIVIVVGGQTPIAAPTDNQGNSYTGLTARVGASGGAMTIYYCLTPITSGTHTFSSTGTGFSAIEVSVFSGVASFDQQSGIDASAGNTSVQPGAITTTTNGALYISGVGGDSSSSLTTNLGFLVTDVQPFTGGINYSSGSAYLIQPVAGSLNPTWFGTFEPAATLATFLPSGGGGGGANPTPCNLRLLGIGCNE